MCLHGEDDLDVCRMDRALHQPSTASPGGNPIVAERLGGSDICMHKSAGPKHGLGNWLKRYHLYSFIDFYCGTHLNCRMNASNQCGVDGIIRWSLLCVY